MPTEDDLKSFNAIRQERKDNPSPHVATALPERKDLQIMQIQSFRKSFKNSEEYDRFVDYLRTSVKGNHLVLILEENEPIAALTSTEIVVEHMKKMKD